MIPQLKIIFFGLLGFRIFSLEDFLSLSYTHNIWSLLSFFFLHLLKVITFSFFFSHCHLRTHAREILEFQTWILSVTISRWVIRLWIRTLGTRRMWWSERRRKKHPHRNATRRCATHRSTRKHDDLLSRWWSQGGSYWCMERQYIS